MNKTVLVTGAGGYIGSVSTYLLLQKGFEVIALDNFSTGYKKPLEVLQKKFGNMISIYQKDLKSDLSEIFKEYPDILGVIHFAAHCLVDESMKDPEKYFDNNVCGTLNLLKNMLDHDIKKIVFSSTCAVYGEAKYAPVDENHPTNPVNPYGLSKRISEQIIECYGKILGLNYTILRYFNVCGASDDGLIGDAKKPSTLLVQNSVRGALNIEPFYLTCPEVNTPDKTPIRDYVDILDLAEAHVKALGYLENGGGNEIINIGTEKGSSVLEIVDAVKKITGVRFDVQKGETREGEYAKMIASIEKARKVLDWEPKRTLEDSIKSLIIWYKSHPKGWEE